MMKKQIFSCLGLICLLILLIACQDSTFPTPENGNTATTNATTTTVMTVAETTVPKDPVCQHVFGQYVVDSLPTCTENGSMYRSCSLCGKKETKTTDATGHVYGEWSETQAATCTSPGRKERTCIQCANHTEREDVPMNKEAHNFALLDLIKPTCIDAGCELYECKYCQIQKNKSIDPDPNNHSFGVEFFVSEKGHAHICQACGIHNTITPHTPLRAEYDNTYHHTVCAVCSTNYNREEHSWQETTVQDPTYQTNGINHKFCQPCGALIVITTDPLEKLTPEYTLPTLSCTYGTRLSEIDLPEGFSFINPGLACGDLGVNYYEAAYTVPNDTEGKYHTVNGIMIPITVTPKPIVIEYDASALDGLVFNGNSVADPLISPEQSHLVKIRWYQGNTLLTQSPINAGNYKVELFVTDERYSAPTVEYLFTIAKAPCPVTSDIIQNRAYTGMPIQFSLPDSETITLRFFDNNQNPIDTPVEMGNYFVTVTVAESMNYLSASFTVPFSVVQDTVPPVWKSETLTYLHTKTAISYTLDAIDNGAVRYYYILPLTNASYSYTTQNPTIELNIGDIYLITAVDYAGNESEEKYIFVQPEGAYLPKAYPQDNSTINRSYVTLSAEWASYYYFGTTPNKDEMEQLSGNLLLFLENGKTYYWYAESAYVSSPVYSFTVNCSLPAKPTLISPEDKAILTAFPELIAESPVKGKVLYAVEDSSVYIEYSYDAGFLYGVTYKWLFEDENGNRTEERTFTYMCNEPANQTGFSLAQNTLLQNNSYLLLKTESIAPLSYIQYLQLHSGEKGHRYSSMSTFHSTEDGVTVTNIRNLQNGDIVYIYAVDIHNTRSQTICIVIDTEAPTLSEVTVDEDQNVIIPVGNDASDTIYRYRIGFGKWIDYTKTVTVSLQNAIPFIEVWACDAAGNESYQSFYFGNPLASPTLISGIIEKPTNQNVTLLLTPFEEGQSFYLINGEEYPLTAEKEITFSQDGEYLLCTGLRTKDNVFYSEPIKIIIDKTAPVLDKIYYKAERFNINGEYTFICFDPSAVIEEHGWKAYYFWQNVYDAPKLTTDGRVPLYAFYVSTSGFEYVDLIIVDEAGNSTTLQACLFCDVEGPSLDDMTLEYKYDEESSETKCIITFNNIIDDYGYYYHMHFQIWDVTGEEEFEELNSIVSLSFFTTPGETSFVYDATHLEEGRTYYFLAYATDDLINGSYSLLYYFTKNTPTT